MESVLSVALSNAIAASLLAVLACLAGRLLRRPAVTHGLWLLVLLKLLTPPLFRVPVSWPTSSGQAEQVTAERLPIENAVEEVRVVIALPDNDAPPQPAPSASERRTDSSPALGAGTETLEPAQTEMPWPLVLGTLWLCGSLAWVTPVWSRVRPMQRLLRFAQPAPDWLTAEVARLAERLGLRRIPVVCLVPGKLSPMLWTLGGPPRLLLPADLLGSLNADQRA